MRLSLCTLLLFFRLSSLRADTSGGDNVGTSHGHDEYHNRLRGSFRRLEDEKVVAPMTRESFVNDCETDFLEETLSDGMITVPEYAKFMADACLSSGGDCALNLPFSALGFKLQTLFVVTYMNMECDKGEVSKDKFDACIADLGITLGADFEYLMVVDQEDEASRARIVKMCEKMWVNAEPYGKNFPD